MLVSTMSLPEIKRSVHKDYLPEIKNRIANMKITYKGKWIRNGRKDFVETVAVPVRSMNTWRITVICSQDSVMAVPYLISYDKYGITASFLQTEYDQLPLMHFNSHFFKRYRERAKIPVDKPEQLVKSFFRKNIVFIPCYSPGEDGIQQLFTPVNGGIGLGNYYPETEICEFKTFVDNSLLKQNQLDEVVRIWSNTMTELTAEMERRMNRRAV